MQLSNSSASPGPVRLVAREAETKPAREREGNVYLQYARPSPTPEFWHRFGSCHQYLTNHSSTEYKTYGSMLACEEILEVKRDRNPTALCLVRPLLLWQGRAMASTHPSRFGHGAHPHFPCLARRAGEGLFLRRANTHAHAVSSSLCAL